MMKSNFLLADPRTRRVILSVLIAAGCRQFARGQPVVFEMQSPSIPAEWSDSAAYESTDIVGHPFEEEPTPSKQETAVTEDNEKPEKPSFESGYENGFFMTTDDSKFKFKLRGLLQARHYSTMRDIDTLIGDDLESGFALERASLVFAGNALSPDLHYWFVVSSNRITSGTIMEEGKISYDLENDALLQIGRMRNPAFLRELDISFARSLGIERSYYNRVFMTGLIEGIVLSKQNDFARAIVVLSDGRHSGSSARLKDFFQDNTDFAFTFGTDWKLDGEWAQFADLTSWTDEGRAIFLGAGVHYERGETGDDVAANNGNHFVAWTGDIAYENSGFMMYASATGRHQLLDGAAIDQNGVLCETSIHPFDDKWELFTRYEYIDFDGFTDVGAGGTPVVDSSVGLITCGSNWYFNRHACKLTAEATYALDPIPLAATNSGILVDQLGREGQTVFGLQLQLFF